MDEKKNNTAERPAPKAPESAPVRRVGTLTLGVCLIACGVLFLCYFFVPHFNWELALKIAPAAGLILLGCEVLYFAARPQRWKYDFLSVLLCIVIIVFLMLLHLITISHSFCHTIIIFRFRLFLFDAGHFLFLFFIRILSCSLLHRFLFYQMSTCPTETIPVLQTVSTIFAKHTVSSIICVAVFSSYSILSYGKII